MKKLTEKELLCFFGGVESSTDKANDDNLNNAWGCRCYYDNSNGFTNSNSADKCACACLKPNS